MAPAAGVAGVAGTAGVAGVAAIGAVSALVFVFVAGGLVIAEFEDDEAFCADLWLSAKCFFFAAFFVDFFVESCFIVSSAFIAGAAGAAGVAGVAGAGVWANATVVDAANAPAISVASNLFMDVPIVSVRGFCSIQRFI